MPWAFCCVPQVISEQFFKCVRVYCLAEGRRLPPPESERFHGNRGEFGFVDGTCQ